MRRSLRSIATSLALAALVATSACSETPTAAATATRSSAATPGLVSSPTSAPATAIPPTKTAQVGLSPAAGTPAAVASPVGSTPSAITPEASAIVEETRAAIAEQLGIAVGQVVVTSVQAVEWGDASLGCPEAGMAYAQVISPGYLIRLNAGTRSYEFHADRKGNVTTCPSPQPPVRVER